MLIIEKLPYDILKCRTYIVAHSPNCIILILQPELYISLKYTAKYLSKHLCAVLRVEGEQ